MGSTTSTSSLFNVDMGAANLVSAKSARRHQALPVAFVDEGTLLLAMADPTNLLALDDVQMATGLSCAVAVAPAGDIESLVTKIGTMQSTISDAITEGEAEAEEASDEAPAEITDLRASAQDGPVMKLVNSILGQAVAEGASDIHFEPEDGDMRIRFRIDGVLQESARVPKRMVAGVVSRIKIMSELDIAEKRIPQDGRVGNPDRRSPGGPASHDPPHSDRRGGVDSHPRRGGRAPDAQRPRHGRGPA